MQIIYALFLIFITLSKSENQSNLTSSFTLNENKSGGTLTEIQCDSKTHFDNITYTWNIHDFDFRRNEKDYPFTSPEFSSVANDQVKWYLSLRPGKSISDTISLFLHCSTENIATVTWAKVSFSFINNDQNLLKFYSYQLHKFHYQYNNDERSLGERYIPIDDVLSSDNSLNIVCNIVICKYTNNVVHRNRTDTTSNPLYNRDRDLVSKNTSINSNISEVVLVLSKNGKEYTAEKAKLAARSPVFAAMFENCTQKGEEIRRINITDIEEQVFDELLKYIYTNKSENIEKFSCDLLVAANKYGLTELERRCVEKITNGLTIDNAVDTLLLADKHGFGDLKTKLVRFIIANRYKIKENNFWERIYQRNIKLIQEIWNRIYE